MLEHAAHFNCAAERAGLRTRAVPGESVSETLCGLLMEIGERVVALEKRLNIAAISMGPGVVYAVDLRSQSPYYVGCRAAMHLSRNVPRGTPFYSDCEYNDNSNFYVLRWQICSKAEADDNNSSPINTIHAQALEGFNSVWNKDHNDHSMT